MGVAAKQMVALRIAPADLDLIDEFAAAAGVTRTDFMIARALGRRLHAKLTDEGRPLQSVCRHPANRRIGVGCGLCGKAKV